jgi:hypothetical protein
MGLWDKLRQSRGPDSYFRYRQKRRSELWRAERQRKSENDSAERRHEKADREHDYKERYTQEIERERAEQSEETDPGR